MAQQLFFFIFFLNNNIIITSNKIMWGITWLLLEQDCKSTITTSLLPFIASFEASLPRLFCN